MDKQKQIEEMAKVIEEAMAKARRTLGGHNNIAKFYATMLVNVGYRKIPANAVVIDKNENPCLSCPVPEDIQRDVDCSTICGAVRLGIDWQNQCKVLVKENKLLTKELAQTRKETAEKFAERLKEQTVDEYDSKGVNHPYVIADYEELDEICKEITDKVVQNGN